MRVKRIAFELTARRSRADALGRGGAGGGLGRREGDEERDDRGGHDVPGGSGEIVGRLDEPGGDERCGAAEESEGEVVAEGNARVAEMRGKEIGQEGWAGPVAEGMHDAQ